MQCDWAYHAISVILKHIAWRSVESQPVDITYQFFRELQQTLSSISLDAASFLN